MLYNEFEIYVKAKTNIKTIYLACGKSLKDVHNFYTKNGWKQINKLNIDMHFANDDDFFKKDYKGYENSHSRIYVGV